MLEWIAWHLPKRLIHWCLIRAMCHATQGRWSHVKASEVLAVDVLARWGV